MNNSVVYGTIRSSAADDFDRLRGVIGRSRQPDGIPPLLMNRTQTWIQALVFGRWAALLPFLFCFGGMSMAAGFSELTEIAATRALSRGLTVLAVPSRRSSPAGKPDSLIPDHAPLSALVVPAGELASHHASVFIEMVRALNGQVPVVALVKDEEEYKLCAGLMEKNGLENRSIHFLDYALDSMWFRDFGPLFIDQAGGGVGVVDASYSGGAHQERWRDDECPILLSQAMGLPLRSMPLRLQGGNLLTNGDGLLLSTTSIPDENKSRGFGVDEISAVLTRCLGADQWLQFAPLVGDATQHVDQFVCFLEADLVVVAEADPGLDPVNATHLDAVAELLSTVETEAGGMRVHRVPLPSRTRDGLVRSYSNVILANDLLLVPTFVDVDPEIEREALETYRRLLPGTQVIPIRCDSLVREGGFLRCMTLGIPRGVPWQRLYRQN